MIQIVFEPEEHEPLPKFRGLVLLFKIILVFILMLYFHLFMCRVHSIGYLVLYCLSTTSRYYFFQPKYTMKPTVYYYSRTIITINVSGCPRPTVGSMLQMCVALVALGLIVAEKGRMDIMRKMSLNVSSDDIHYALDKVTV